MKAGIGSARALAWVCSRLVAVAVLAPGVLARPAQLGTIGAFPTVAVPPGNPQTPEKVLLGFALFFEEQLSADNTMACATCHLPEAGGTDVRAGAREPGLDGLMGNADDEFGSPGMLRQNGAGDFKRHVVFGVEPQATGRHAPSVINAAFFRSLFWDLRASPVFRDRLGNVVLPDLAALESQAVAPPLSSIEMANEGRDWDDVLGKLERVTPLALARDLPLRLEAFLAGAQGYGELFERAFGSAGVTRERVAMAIAAYERTLVADQTPFDLGTMNAQETEGLNVFSTRAFCGLCHVPPLFSDGGTHSIGLPDHFRSTKTPTLRNVGLQRRLTSSGQFASLDEVVLHYEAVGFTFGVLTAAERAALRAFLGTGLTDARVASRMEPFDRPRLHSELAPRGSNQYGEPWPGTGAVAPRLLADVPANLGHREFKIGVGDGRGGAPVALVVSARAAARSLHGMPVHVSLARADARLRAGVLDAQGTATFRWRLPTDPALLGLSAFAQAFVSDPAAVGGLAATRGARIDLFSER